MKRLSFSILTLFISSALGGTVVAVNDDNAAILTQVSGYRSWSRVNQEPVKVEAPITITGGTVAINPAVLS